MPCPFKNKHQVERDVLEAPRETPDLFHLPLSGPRDQSGWGGGGGKLGFALSTFLLSLQHHRSTLVNKITRTRNCLCITIWTRSAYHDPALDKLSLCNWILQLDISCQSKRHAYYVPYSPRSAGIHSVCSLRSTVRAERTVQTRRLPESGTRPMDGGKECNRQSGRRTRNTHLRKVVCTVNLFNSNNNKKYL